MKLLEFDITKASYGYIRNNSMYGLKSCSERDTSDFSCWLVFHFVWIVSYVWWNLCCEIKYCTWDNSSVNELPRLRLKRVCKGICAIYNRFPSRFRLALSIGGPSVCFSCHASHLHFWRQSVQWKLISHKRDTNYCVCLFYVSLLLENSWCFSSVF